MNPQRPLLKIFVHRASALLTDHESHGDGLICFSLLNGLAERGHTIYAFTDRAAIKNGSERLHTKSHTPRSPVHSLNPWELNRTADQWLAELSKEHKFDLVWRMQPFGDACPLPPKTGGLPLVVGPLLYSWPESSIPDRQRAKSRFGFSLKSVLTPAALNGWDNTLKQAKLLFCMTEPHAQKMEAQYSNLTSLPLPVIVDPPDVGPRLPLWTEINRPIRLVFAAHLLPHKHPQVFCETVRLLRERGLNVQGTLLGDGTERAALEAWARDNGLAEYIIFQGRVSHEQVWKFMREADFLVSNSIGEPYGRGIVEAMSLGTPTICHRSGGPADFIEHGCSSLLVDELAAPAYAAALAPYLENPGKWLELSAGALRAAQAWRADKVLEHVENALYSVRDAAGGQR